MNSIDTKNMKEDDGEMNERVANLEKIAENTALRLGSLERITAALVQNVATLTQDVATLTQDVAALSQSVASLTQNVGVLTQKVAKLELDVGIIQATYVTKEEFQKGQKDLQKSLHAMTWKIIGSITLLVGAVFYLARYNAVPYLQPAPAVSAAPASSMQAKPLAPRTP